QNDNTLVALGDAHQDLQEFELAIEFYDKAISLNDKNSAAFVNRGNCKVELGLNVEGCKDYNRALELGDTRVQENIDEYCKPQIPN
ncbi:MAG: tetratricopeptide repeat protein, partial [Mucilaginibacter sp.]|nr:tetratricopeptide repeat protein [Mucilaginibacter sp.]